MYARIDAEFKKLQSVYPEATITADREFVLIPEVQLPSKFNMPSTPVLISVTPQYSMIGVPGVPAVYVSKALRVHGRKSMHLDENLTESEMLENGWVKLCWYNAPIVKGLRELLANVILYLERLVD